MTLLRFALPLLLTVSAGGAMAADAVLVHGGGLQVDTTDVQAEVLRMAPEARKALLGRAESVGQLASNLYLRRALAGAAQKQGLAQDPQLQAALRLATERVLADAYLAKLEAEGRPSADVLTAQASASYKANPQKYTVPEQVRARHILVAKGPEAQAKAQALLAKLQAGADFAALAKTESADTVSGAKGGDLGYFGRGQMVPSFEQAAFALQQPGERSGLVESDFGLHIIELQGRRPAGLLPFEEVREELEREILKKQVAGTRLRAQNQVMVGVQHDRAAAAAFAASQR